MKNQIIVSVVMPVYNGERYILELLNCFSNQSINNWELIIVDDISSDETYNLITNFSKNDSRIKLIKRNREPKGAQTCRNIGIDNAKGKYIIIIDSDDLISNEFLEQRVKFMENNPDIDYATLKGICFRTLPNGEKMYGRKWGIETKKDLLNCFLSVNYPFSVWNNIYKLDVVKKIKFDEKLKIYQDFDFVIRTILLNYRHAFFKDSKIDYYYRQGHSGAMTKDFVSSEKYESTKYLFTKTIDSIKELKKFKKYKNSFYKFHIMQFERILIGNDKFQIYDFYNYILEQYKEKNNLRLKIIRKLIRNNFSKRKIHLIMSLFYNPIEICTWALNKIKNTRRT